MERLEKINLLLKKETMLEYDKKITSKNNLIDFIIKNEELDIKAEMELWVVVLDIKNHILGYGKIAQGGTSSAMIDIKNIFKRVFLLNGEKIILIKNNPTGSSKFSNCDIDVKNKVQEACNILNIEFLDFILTEKRYTSLIYE